MNRPNTKGTTLIELLLSVALSATMIMITMVLLSNLFQMRTKNQVILEIDQAGSSIMQTMTQHIRNSDSIVAPTQGVSDSELSLGMATASVNPTVFDVSDGIMHITEGSNASIALHTSNMTLSGFTATNVSRTDTPGVVQLQFTLTRLNPSGRNEYNSTKTFYGTASLR